MLLLMSQSRQSIILKNLITCNGDLWKNYDEEEAVLSGFSIGTPATRADTIKKLKDIGYIFQKIKVYYVVS